MASLGLSAADRSAIEDFKKMVIEPSMTHLVILDFWAEWCGPCKALTPVLEKVAAAYADRGVMLAKVNVDENRLVAEQFRVQSIPTVYAVFQGQLVADLTSARTESQLTRMLDQILKQLPIQGEGANQAAELEPLIAMGEQVLTEGDAERALGIFGQLADMAPDHPQIAAGHARALIALARLDEAQAVLDAVPEAAAKEAAIGQARAALALARDAGTGDTQDLAPLRAALDQDPASHEARLALAKALIGAGERQEAADLLLAMIADDREWNEGAARQHLLRLFEAVGLEDPWVAAQRRRLSAVLFG